MNNQETVNFVAAALRKQGAQSVRHGQCAYRGPDGSKCAIGHLISDAAAESLEGCSMGEEGCRVARAVRDSGCTADAKVLAALQVAHDDTPRGVSFVHNFNHWLSILCEDHGLEYPK